jgi:oxygen-independent coproporphyrinogen-3 oxidase
VDPPEREHERAQPGTPLYVHLPFCVAKCTYCDFFSVAAEGQDLDATLEAILREARERAPRGPRTLYLGGGTPSLLSVDQLARLLEGLEQVCGWRASAREVTAECNPESLDRVKARGLLDLGVTRLSIGFQSLRQPTLELFGRVHGVEQCFQAFAAARDAGARHVNVDLIYAAPGQSLAEWQEDLERVIELSPEHLSAYNLTFEEETPFSRWLAQGRLSQADEETELQFLHWTRARLAEAGLAPYEISNFARADEACEHNLNYWRNGAYVGIGPSAASKVGNTRAGNVRHVDRYRRRAQLGRSATVWSERLPSAARLAESWWLGLRLSEGVAPERTLAESGASPEAGQALLQLARDLSEQGFLECAAGRYRLTERGLPLADALARRFLTHLDRAARA